MEALYKMNCAGLNFSGGLEILTAIFEKQKPFKALNLRGQIKIGPEDDSIFAISDTLDDLIAAVRITLADPAAHERTFVITDKNNQRIMLVTKYGACEFNDILSDGFFQKPASIIAVMQKGLKDFSEIAIQPTKDTIRLINTENGYWVGCNKNSTASSMITLPCTLYDHPEIIAGMVALISNGNISGVSLDIPSEALKLIRKISANENKIINDNLMDRVIRIIEKKFRIAAELANNSDVMYYYAFDAFDSSNKIENNDFLERATLLFQPGLAGKLDGLFSQDAQAAFTEAHQSVEKKALEYAESHDDNMEDILKSFFSHDSMIELNIVLSQGQNPGNFRFILNVRGFGPNNDFSVNMCDIEIEPKELVDTRVLAANIIQQVESEAIGKNLAEAILSSYCETETPKIR